MKIEIYVRNYNVIHILRALNEFLAMNPHKDNKIVFKEYLLDNTAPIKPINFREYRQTIKFYMKDHLESDFLKVCSNLFKQDISFRLSFHSLNGQTVIVNNNEIINYEEENKKLVSEALNSIFEGLTFKV